MQVRNCPQCGKIFTFIRTNLCPECQKQDEENFKIVRKYISQNPGVDIEVVSENTGISEEKILKYLREGRIVSGVATQIKLECELCGTFISGGRYCTSCQEKLTAGLKKVIHEENQKILQEKGKTQANTGKKGVRMHTADLWQRNKHND